MEIKSYQDKLNESIEWYKEQFPDMSEQDCIVMAERDLEYEEEKEY